MTPFYTILTHYGKTALAEALAAEQPLEIPHMAVGDGGGEYYEPTENQTNLRNERWCGDLNDLRTDEETQGQVIAEAIIPHGIDGDWTAREIGLFDAKGGLIAIGKYPETYIPSALSGARSQIYINIIIHVDNVAAVALIVRDDTVIASKLFVENLITQMNLNVSQMRNELVVGAVYPSDVNRVIKTAATVPGGVSHLRTASGLLAAFDNTFMSTPHTLLSLPVETAFNSYEITTDKGVFEFVSMDVLFLRGRVTPAGAQIQAYVEGWLPKDPTPTQVRLSHQKAIDYCVENDIKLTSKSGVIYRTDGTINFRNLRNLDYLAEIRGTGDFITAILGGESTNTQQYYTQKIYKANRGGPSSAIRIIGSVKNQLHIGEASIIEMYADTHSSKEGKDEWCAYNKIYVGSVIHFKVDANPNTDGSIVQWINENQIYFSFCHYFTMYDRGYKHNGNQIFGGNFEANGSYINLETGIGNTFYNIRGESTLSVKFGANASNNTVLTDWIESPNNPVAGRTVENLGLNNAVKNTQDIYNDSILLCGFNGSTLRKNGERCNVLGVNPNLTFSSVDNTVTASANQLIYSSQLVEISPGNQYFHVVTHNKLVGGIRMNIVGYDDNMTAIASSGNDVHYPGATAQDTGFGVNSTTTTNSSGTRRIHIKNRNARWIKLEVYASSLGCTFRSFEFSAVTSDKVGKLTLARSAMVSNV